MHASSIFQWHYKLKFLQQPLTPSFALFDLNSCRLSMDCDSASLRVVLILRVICDFENDVILRVICGPVANLCNKAKVHIFTLIDNTYDSKLVQ